MSKYHPAPGKKNFFGPHMIYMWYSINEKTQAYMVIIMADLKGVVSLKYAENKPDSILKRKKEGGKEINLA